MRTTTTQSAVKTATKPQPMQLLWFIQIKVQGIWVFLYPTMKTYGYATIESCEEAIVELEKLDEEWNMESEYRMKEELV